MPGVDQTKKVIVAGFINRIIEDTDTAVPFKVLFDGTTIFFDAEGEPTREASIETGLDVLQIPGRYAKTLEDWKEGRLSELHGVVHALLDWNKREDA